MKGDRLVINGQPDLQVYLNQETDAKIRLKLAFLQCFAQLKADLEPLSQSFGIATSTGYWWIRNWNKYGYEGLQESRGGNAGRPPRLDEVDLDYLSLLLKEKGCWTTQEARELIKVTFGIDYSPGQVVRILRKRLKMHFCKPFPHDYRRPVNAEDLLKERLEKVFKELKQKGLKKRDIALGFVDETSPQNRANTVRVWSYARHPVMIKNTDRFNSNTIGF
jgi:transposase